MAEFARSSPARMVKGTLTRIAYPMGLGARFVSPMATEPDPFRPTRDHGPSWTLWSRPPTVLLAAEEAKARPREIVEGFFFRWLRTEGGKRICRRLDKTPPSLRQKPVRLRTVDLPVGFPKPWIFRVIRRSIRLTQKSLDLRWIWEQEPRSIPDRTVAGG